MSSAGAVHVHVHIPQGCLSPDCDGKGKPPEGTPLESRGTPLQEKADAHETFSKVGCGPGPAGLWHHTHFGKKKTEEEAAECDGAKLNIRADTEHSNFKT